MNRKIYILLALVALLPSLMRAQDKAFFIRSGNYYLHRVYNTSTHIYSLDAVTTFDTACVWFSPSANNYYCVDAGGQKWYIASNYNVTGFNATGTLLYLENESNVNTNGGLNNNYYYFYNWDWGLAHGEQLTCDDSYPASWYSSGVANCNPGNELWECYWVVYEDGAFKMSTTAQYEHVDHYATFSPIRIKNWPAFVASASGGFNFSSSSSISYNSSVTPSVNFTDYGVRSRQQYTSYMLGELSNCEGNWTVRHCDTIYTHYNFYAEGSGDPTLHVGITPDTVDHIYTAADAQLTCTLSGEGATYVSFANTPGTTVTSTSPTYPTIPTLYYVNPCASSGVTVTLTMTAVWPDGSTQTISTDIELVAYELAPTTITFNHGSGNPFILSEGQTVMLDHTFTPTEWVSPRVTVVPTDGTETPIFTDNGNGVITGNTVGTQQVTITSAVAAVSTTGYITVLPHKPYIATSSGGGSDNEVFVTNLSSCSGGTLYYTTDGNDPTTASATTTSGDALADNSTNPPTSLTFSVGEVIKAIYVCNGLTSEVAEVTVGIFADGPTIGGAVFGGGRMADVDGDTRVVVVVCDTISAVYGGNDIAGQVTGSSEIYLGTNDGTSLAVLGVTGGDIRIGSVYGGGNGYYKYDSQMPAPAVGTTVFTDKQFSSSVTEVNGTDSYATTGYIPTIQNTAITVSNDFVHVDSLFGGAKNAFVLKTTDNSTAITIDGGTIYSVFGGNNYGGTLGAGSNHAIDVNMTTFTTTEDVHNTTRTGFGRDYGIRYLYGGGNKVAGQNTVINFVGGQVDTLFGGGNSADVASASIRVNVPKDNLISSGAVYGWDGNNVVSINRNYLWNTKHAYNIRTLFGGNNAAAMSGLPILTLTRGHVGTVYGGGNAGPMNSNSGPVTLDGKTVYYGTYVNVASNNMLIDYLYGGCQKSDVLYSTYVKIEAGHVGTLYGGCNISGDVGSAKTNAVTDATNPLYYAVNGGTWVQALGGNVYGNLFAGSNGYYHCNNNTLYIAGKNFAEGENYVGLEIPTHNETHVLVSGVSVSGNVYAGANMANVGFDQTYGGTGRLVPVNCGLSSVKMTSGYVSGSVYGGGNMASVNGIAEVEVSGGTIAGSLYGGNDKTGQVGPRTTNRQLDNHLASDGVTPLTHLNASTYVWVHGNPTIERVYGGGNGAYDYPTMDFCDTTHPEQTSTFVDINLNGGNVLSTSGKINRVFGGGNGTTVTGSITVLLNTTNSPDGTLNNVETIFGGNDKGALAIVPTVHLIKGQAGTVYGGCNKGVMTGSANVWAKTDDNQKIDTAEFWNVSSYVRLTDNYFHNDAVNIPEATPDVYIGTVYGGSCMADVTHSSLVIVEGGDHSNTRIFGGNDIGGDVLDTSRVLLIGGTVKEIYGAGNGNYQYLSDGEVHYNDGTLIDHNVSHRPNSIVSEVLLESGTCNYNVYAGGLAGDCGDTRLIVDGDAVLKGNLFGGGRGFVDSIGFCSIHVGDVTGTAYTELRKMQSSGSTMHAVYGGGHNGDCANTQVDFFPTFEYRLPVLYGGCMASNLTGTATVTIDGNENLNHYNIDTVYGGNDYSGLTQNTVLTINSGRFETVFGAGNGDYDYYGDLHASTLVNPCLDTVPYSMVVDVTFFGGYYSSSVYGGGNLGLVGNRDMNPNIMKATSDLDGRNANIGRITMNIHGGEFGRHVFAGACGEADMKKRFFGGPGVNFVSYNGTAGKNVDNSGNLGNILAYAQKIVNMDGGNIHFSLYGGSESVDDGYLYECIGNKDVYYYSAGRLTSTVRGNHQSTMRPSSIINIMGGTVQKSVYGGGYQGNAYGSIYVNVGQYAINRSPVWTKVYGSDVLGAPTFTMLQYKPTFGVRTPTSPANRLTREKNIDLQASVYNGSDWGEADDQAFFSTRGVFGGETNILVDGLGYNTMDNLPTTDVRRLQPTLDINYSLIGAGTSTEGGDVNRLITVRHYGNYYACAENSKSLASIQRADKVVLDSVFITLTGEQDAFSAYTSPDYSFCRIDTLIFSLDNVVILTMPGVYIGNVSSLKDRNEVYNINAPTKIYHNIGSGDGGTAVYTGRSQELLDNLGNNTISGECTGNVSDCEDYSFCFKVPSERGESQKSGAFNTLVLSNGSYLKVYPYVDNNLDNNEEAHDFGSIYGYMYLVNGDNTMTYVYARQREDAGSDDGGFVAPCTCDNNPDITSSSDPYYRQMTFIDVEANTTILYPYRTWRFGSNQGDRSRHITLVANANPDNRNLNFDLPTGSYTQQYSNNTTSPVTVTSSDYLAYATTTLELPPANGGSFYIMTPPIIDADNGNQLELVDEGYNAASGNFFGASSLIESTPSGKPLSLIHDPSNRDYFFGLTFSSAATGSNFEDGTCWLHHQYSPNSAGEPTDFYHSISSVSTGAVGFSRNLYSGTIEPGSSGTVHYGNGTDYPYTNNGTEPVYLFDGNNCWPTSIISGSTFVSQVGGYLSPAIAADGVGIIPTLNFTLTYDKRLTTTITREVLFTLYEFDKDGNYVGPVNVTVTISTVLRDFSDLEAPVLAMYNEGISDEFVRKVTIPASFKQRDVYLEAIEWEKNPDVALLASHDDWFYMHDTVTSVDETTITSPSQFAIVVTPTEAISESVTNHLGWYDIHTDQLDLHSIAKQYHEATPGANAWSSEQEPQDVNNPILTSNNDRKYDSDNINGATNPSEIIQSSLADGKGLKVGTLDGRATASINVRLQFDGDRVYRGEPYPENLAYITLRFHWYDNKPSSDGLQHDGTFDLVIKLKTREHGDTIYMAPGETLTRTAGGTSFTMHSFDYLKAHPEVAATVDGWNPSYATQSLIDRDVQLFVRDNPDAYVRDFKEVQSIYEEGDVISIMEPITIATEDQSVRVSGTDYSLMQIIRYSGNHYKFPTVELANTKPMIILTDNGILNISNVWLNGSGCTRAKKGTSATLTDNGNHTTIGSLNYYENYPREKALVFANAPMIYMINGGTITMANNVRLSNNFNNGSSSDANSIFGGALYVGPGSEANLVNNIYVYDNMVVDNSFNNPSLEMADNFGGGIYVNGGKLKVGVNNRTTHNNKKAHIDIARNFYLKGSANDATGVVNKRRIELSTPPTEFEVYVLDTLRQPQSFFLSNVGLARTTAADVCPGPVRRDITSSVVYVVGEMDATSGIGVSKWFPGYPYDGSGLFASTADHRLYNMVPRDTIGIAKLDRQITNAGLLQRVYESNVFFNDSSYYVAANPGTGDPDVSEAFLPDSNGRVAYSDNTTDYPAYRDNVMVFYHNLVENKTIYLHRCASFGKGVSQRLVACTEGGTTTYFNEYTLGDSIYFLMNPEATCVASTDTIMFHVGGGFFPYTYKWYYDEVKQEHSGSDPLQLERHLIRTRETSGGNHISNLSVAAYERLRQLALVDTLVLTDLQQRETSMRSTYFYEVIATDLTGHCEVSQPVIVQVAKQKTGNYYSDDDNFLLHRNPYAIHDNYPGAGDGHDGYYEEFAVSNGELTDDEHPEYGSGVRQDHTGHNSANLRTLIGSSYGTYRVAAPGVDSSSFHDRVPFGYDESSNIYFINKDGNRLYPFARPWSVDGTEEAAFQAHPNNDNAYDDTLGFELRIGSIRYRTSSDQSVVYSTDGGSSWAVTTEVDASDLIPQRSVALTHNDATTTADEGIRRAGYTHLPMHWYEYDHNRGTLDDRAKAEAHLGKPYGDVFTDANLGTNAAVYVDNTGAEDESLRSKSTLYANAMVPRYLRVYQSHYVTPTIMPELARGEVGIYANDGTTPISSTTELCAGDIVYLRPRNIPLETEAPHDPRYEYVAWDFDPSASENTAFVVNREDELNSPIVYYSPNKYWWQQIYGYSLTSAQGDTHTATQFDYIEHYNGDVTIKTRKGLAWLISVVNGYNGQNAHTFHFNTITLDFIGGNDSVNMGDYRWTPLGNQNHPFEGTFVGAIGTDTAKISDIIVNETTTPLTAMFGYTQEADISGFKLSGSMIKGNSRVAAIIAQADQGTHLHHVTYNAGDGGRLFGQYITGGAVATAHNATLNNVTVKKARLEGAAVYAGGLFGTLASVDTIFNNCVTFDQSNLSAIYFGGMGGYTDSTLLGSKDGNRSVINNNYVSILSNGKNQRVGGLVGRASSVSLNNNYVYGSAQSKLYSGGLVGYLGSDVDISNCYYLDGMSDDITGYDSENGSTTAKSSTFRGRGRNVILTHPVDGYSNLTRALNRWVTLHGDTLYNRWRSDLVGENNGYPVFGDPDMIYVRTSLDTAICDEIEWDGISFYETGTYVFHVVDSADYLDSTFLLNVTIFHGDTTEFADSVLLGQPYVGHGISLTADEVNALFGDDHSHEIRVMQIVDSLMNEHGCDSLVVLTLYIRNDNVGSEPLPQQLVDVKVYPNPTRGIVYVEGSDLTGIEVYDNVSRRLLQRSVDSDKVSFDLTDKPAGSYFVRVSTAHGTVVKKVIKK